MIIIDNQRIADLFQVGVTKLYAKCNEQTAKLLHLFNQLAAQRSQLITFDRAELSQLLDSGIITYGASTVANHGSPSDVSKAIRSQLSSTVLAPVDLKTARAAGCVFIASEEVLDKVPMDYLGGGFDMLGQLIKDGGVVHRGVYIGSSPRMQCFTLLAGLDPPLARLESLADKAKMNRSSVAAHFGIDDGAP
jgi:hypothetical protein